MAIWYHLDILPVDHWRIHCEYPHSAAVSTDRQTPFPPHPSVPAQPYRDHPIIRLAASKAGLARRAMSNVSWKPY
eukprot:7886462-Pyramimonas_sp.AAC.2